MVKMISFMKDKNRKARMDAQGKIGGWFGALCYMVLGFMKEIIFTIVPQKNVVLTNDRSGLTRSAMFLFIFIIIHAVGHLHELHCRLWEAEFGHFWHYSADLHGYSPVPVP